LRLLRQRSKGERLKFSRQVLLSAALAVGLLTATPAVAQAPARSMHQLSVKELAAVMVKEQWANNFHREYACLVQLVQRESGWRVTAHNKSSGAFGLFQFLPSTWKNYKYPFKPLDPQVQIKAGLRYIFKRYETPCGAWNFWKKKAGPDLRGGWY
jgi:soluble lytic murein transglycosylase-like protein